MLPSISWEIRRFSGAGERPILPQNAVFKEPLQKGQF